MPDPSSVLLLLGAGLAAGFVAGLVGVGGGVIFAPVLFFYFQATGVDPAVLTPLTIGSSLLCTCLAALVSAWFQHRKAAVRGRVALAAGTASALAVFLMTRFVTTQPWYDATLFQIVFSLILLVVVVRMVGSRWGDGAETEAEPEARAGLMPLAGIGTAAGAVASAVGVGGGVVLVPAYHNLLRLPIHLSVGTSSATIVLISLVGVLHYAVLGLGAPVPAAALGYVEVGTALMLAIPAAFSARFGVWTAHRIDTQALRWTFAFLALVVAVRLLMRALL